MDIKEFQVYGLGFASESMLVGGSRQEKADRMGDMRQS